MKETCLSVACLTRISVFPSLVPAFDLSFFFASQHDESQRAVLVDLQHLNVNQIQVVVRRCSSPNVTEETTYFIPRNPVVDAGTNTDPPVVCCPLLRRFCPCPPRGLLASLVTKGKERF